MLFCASLECASHFARQKSIGLCGPASPRHSLSPLVFCCLEIYRVLALNQQYVPPPWRCPSEPSVVNHPTSRTLLTSASLSIATNQDDVLQRAPHRPPWKSSICGAMFSGLSERGHRLLSFRLDCPVAPRFLVRWPTLVCFTHSPKDGISPLDNHLECSPPSNTRRFPLLTEFSNRLADLPHIDVRLSAMWDPRRLLLRHADSAVFL